MNFVCDATGDSWKVVNCAKTKTDNRYRWVFQDAPDLEGKTYNVEVHDFEYKEGHTHWKYPVPFMQCIYRPKNFVKSMVVDFDMKYGKETAGALYHEIKYKRGITNKSDINKAEEHMSDLDSKFSAIMSTSHLPGFSVGWSEESEEKFAVSIPDGKQAYIYQIRVTAGFYDGSSISSRGCVVMFDSIQKPPPPRYFGNPYTSGNQIYGEVEECGGDGDDGESSPYLGA